MGKLCWREIAEKNHILQAFFAGVEKVMAGKMQMVTIMNTWVRFFVITDKCQQHCLPKSHQL